MDTQVIPENRPTQIFQHAVDPEQRRFVLPFDFENAIQVQGHYPFTEVWTDLEDGEFVIHRGVIKLRGDAPLCYDEVRVVY